VDRQRREIVETLFQAALDLPQEQRRAFLEQSGNDATVIAEVLTLLEHHDSGREFFSPPPEPDADLPDRIGPFDIVSVLGEGGMGVVYHALQREPVRRPVALKLVKPGMDSREVLQRFELERQALAQLEHPNIAHIYEAGVTPGGQPYFAMEYVDGRPINRYCDEERLTSRQRVKLLADVCQGIQAAHQRGIIHRDLKPSNILVTTQSGKPVPKIIDFGVAKATDQRVAERKQFTQLGQLIGTPEYMSPEQAQGQDVDTRTDVYSLGVILYELLVGVLPLDIAEIREAGFEAMIQLIQEKDPSRPSTRVSTLGEAASQAAHLRRTKPAALARTLRGELDWIALKALEKDRDRRYPTVAGLQADLAAHLSDEPVQARPATVAYQLRKFARRHWTGVSIALVGLLGLVLFAVGVAVQANRIARERDRANQQTQIAEQVKSFLEDLFESSDPAVARGDTLTAKQLLERGAERIDEIEDPRVRAELLGTLSDVYASLGLLNEARSFSQRAFDLWTEVEGPGQPRTLIELNDMAGLESLLGRNDVADSLFAVAIAGWRALGMDDNPRALDPAQNRANVQIKTGQWEEAAAGLIAVAEARRRIGGDDDPKLLATLRHLAGLREDQERYDEALALHKDVVTRRRRVLGNDHPDTIVAMADMAAVYAHLDSLEQADSLLTEALELGRRVLGEDHFRYRRMQSSLGIVLLRSSKFARAEPLFISLVDFWRRTLGPEHPRTLTAMNNLAVVYGEWGHYREAEPVLRELVETRHRVLGEDHPYQQQTRFNLALIEASLGHPQAALEQLRIAVAHGFAHSYFLDEDAQKDFAALQGKPEYEALLDTVRQRLESR
jgi:serine/threonine protein kinase